MPHIRKRARFIPGKIVKSSKMARSAVRTPAKLPLPLLRTSAGGSPLRDPMDFPFPAGACLFRRDYQFDPPVLRPSGQRTIVRNRLAQPAPVGRDAARLDAAA